MVSSGFGASGAQLRLWDKVRKEASALASLGRFRTWPKFKSPESEVVFEVRPAIYDPKHLDRVVKVGFQNTLEQEKAKLDATHAQTVLPGRVELEDVLVVGARIFPSSAGYRFKNNPLLRSVTRSWPSYEHAVMTNSVPGLMYFGHWLRDDCAAHELTFPEGATHVSVVRPAWADCSFYEAAFGQSWDEQAIFFAHRLTMLIDIGFSEDKRARLYRLRQRLRSKIVPAGNRVVYLRRGPNADPRTMVNEEQLISALKSAGVTIIDCETGGDVISASVLDAQVIISIEGSQLSHATYNVADGGAILVLQPPNRFYNPHHEWSRLIGVRYGIVVGEAVAERYTISPDEVLAMLHRLLA